MYKCDLLDLDQLLPRGCDRKYPNIEQTISPYVMI